MEILGAFFIGLTSGMVGAISTGGGLISIPGLVFLGVPPVSAIATTRLSAISGGLTSLYKYNRSKSIQWKYLPYFMVISLVAGLIGPRLLLSINQDLVERIIGVLLLLMLPLLVLGKDFGIVSKPKQRKHRVWGLLVLFFVMIYGTMFGAGGGIFLIYTLIYFFGMTVTESNATGTALWLIGTVVALITYIVKGVVVFSVGLPLLIGAMFGGYIGAHLALKKGTAWVKWVLSVVIILSSLKLILL